VLLQKFLSPICLCHLSKLQSSLTDLAYHLASIQFIVDAIVTLNVVKFSNTANFITNLTAYYSS